MNGKVEEAASITQQDVPCTFCGCIVREFYVHIYSSYKPGAIQFKNFIATSKPMKQAAFAGKARSITGTTPL